ncbi:thiamine biosynthesis protein ApbE [candidate division WOR-1 bacterium RIFCSPHIGHO2_01_FULL_53_15]|uniref:Thiamine biosynthesis protein ApbE n=1 Tax=candidate division WOR-1 bacterium RIFCSPHIGHO2_01_FULL_53_15 TaxID=1802564 RepID=A0A1F4Q1Q5_UNCSA|nr:MAG: thiamine biosynthesis protein ApbE [candidate division WOR-1 bacterium RIFCSPHIGHO2_01_FULL_53_15]OGC13092.1 MAG: thiamine biosynthesis protein ApbE [candidate division WOR-1 bacterium RIFCSPHIGHO2_02_FULL_53_26]
MAYEERTYRNYVKADNLVKFEVIEKETDLLILAEQNLYDKALALTLKYRTELESYIQRDRKFLEALSPHRIQYDAPLIVKEMASASRKVRVGPMAAVAGAVAEFVGKDLRQFTDEIIVENGGDIFLKINQPRKVGIYAGASPFSEKIALEVEPRSKPFSVCTSSGTVGHSLSFGKADAVVVIAESALLADAAATAIGNAVTEVTDIEKGLKFAKKIRGLDGVLIIKDDQMGALGRVKIVPL